MTKNTNITDEELIQRIVEDNNSDLFGVLYDRYASVVYNKCYGFSKNSAEAEDLTQEVFIKLFLKLGAFKGKSKFSTWLYSFVYNHCVNYVNRDIAKKQEKVTVVTDVIEDVDIEEIEDADLFQMKSDKLLRALEIIEPSDKMVLLMKYQDDMTIKEIEENLDLGSSAVKMRIKRAKARVVEVYNSL